MDSPQWRAPRAIDALQRSLAQCSSWMEALRTEVDSLLGLVHADGCVLISPDQNKLSLGWIPNTFADWLRSDSWRSLETNTAVTLIDRTHDPQLGTECWLILNISRGEEGVIVWFRRASEANPWTEEDRQMAGELRVLLLEHLVRVRRSQVKRDHLAYQQRFQRILDALSPFVGLLTPDGTLIEVNRSALEIAQLTREEVIGKKLTTTYWWTDPPALASQLELAILQAARGETVRFDVQIRVAENRRCWIDMQLSPLLDASGEVELIVGSAVDMTERRQAEESLRLGEARIRGIVNTAPDAIMTLNESGQIESANLAAERLFGYTSEELLGKPISELTPGDSHADQPYIPQVGRYERVARRRNGEQFPIELSIGEMRVGFKRILIGIVHDLTERKHLEKQLLQAQKMEAIGRLAGGVAHDFNNLLSIILASSSTLLDEMDPEDEAYALVSEIEKAGERAAGLTRQLLAFSRGQILETKILDLNQVILGVVRMLRRLIGEDIDLVTRLAPDLGRIRADLGQLEQVILNLAVNSRDAMPDGGRIVIRTRNVSEEELPAEVRQNMRPGPCVMMSLRDTGCGMDETTKSHLFEPFFTTKGPGKGTGLGLATVYGIVKQSEGHITVESEPGKGALFCIYLPRVDAAPADDWLATNKMRDQFSGHETVLLVEDETDVRALASRLLKKRGYRVLEASDGHEALEIVEKQTEAIDLLLTDVVMPKMNGRELANRILQLRPNMRILYFSGYTDDSILRHGINAAGIHFLQKPFTPDTLARKVREVIDQKV